MRENFGKGVDLVAIGLMAKKNPDKFYQEFVKIEMDQGYDAAINFIKLSLIYP